MMHDSDVSRTTNGTGTIENMTLAEVEGLSLDLYGEEKIPTLNEIIDVLRETDVVLVFELKTSDQGLVDALKNVLDKTDFYDQIVVISFHEGSLARMKAVLPEVATADLNPVSAAPHSTIISVRFAPGTPFSTTNGITRGISNAKEAGSSMNCFSAIAESSVGITRLKTKRI